MAKIHSLGFPRIGGDRELKFALESFWRGNASLDDLLSTGKALRQQNWRLQRELDYVPVGDFSFYDQVLDMSMLLGNLPKRSQAVGDGTQTPQELQWHRYFRAARGRSAIDSDCACSNAADMTKWFDTNYHYIVPELEDDTEFFYSGTYFESCVQEALTQGITAKPVIIGPLTYLKLAKVKGQKKPLDYVKSILPAYQKLLSAFANLGVEWVQIDEPILVTDLDSEWAVAFTSVYEQLKECGVKLLLATYFGSVSDNLPLLGSLPVAGFHLDIVAGDDLILDAVEQLSSEQVLSLGVVNGRNIWATDVNTLVNRLSPINDILKDRLWLAPSCSLLHVPIDVSREEKLQEAIKPWLAFAMQKLKELQVLSKVLNGEAVSETHEFLENNHAAIIGRQQATLARGAEMFSVFDKITPQLSQRKSDFVERSFVQAQKIDLPLFPTTTIGSFPQTDEIRKVRQRYKKSEVSGQFYLEAMHREIQSCIEKQEAFGLDVLVHGEPERNDMVEYFGEQLEGFVAISQFGWVQSYGSRCVKPPILYSSVKRKNPMTLEWILYAQSLTPKPVKGMLTGPVTILNWSFVRDDQPRSQTCFEIGLAIREEVLELEAAGIQIIQIDEAALREGLPLRRSQWQDYLQWATESFRISANGVKDETQIHTHMCYSEFNDIIEAIVSLDADVITIEAARSDMELLSAFEKIYYPNQIGPGVYDIHSPNTPSVGGVIERMRRSAEKIPPERLWVNPDCGLKTRKWSEVAPALENMVVAARELREMV